MQELNLSRKTSYEQTTDQPKQHEVFKATPGNRVIGFILDLLCVVLLFVVLQSSVVQPIANKAFNLDEKTNQYKERLLESHLYEPGTYYEVEYDCLSLDQSFDTEKGVAFNHYHEKIIYFYNTFETSNEKGEKLIDITKYYTLIVESGLFDVTGSVEEPASFNAVPKSSTTEEQMREFYQQKAYPAATDALSYDEVIITLANTLTFAQVIEMLVALTISVLVFLFIIPICTKKHQTLGMMMMKTAVVSRATGFRCSKVQLLVRFLILYLFEAILSIFTVGIPVLVSFTMMVFGKENTSIHDHFSATLVVDASRTKIYKNEREFLEALAKYEDMNGRYRNTYISDENYNDSTKNNSSENND